MSLASKIAKAIWPLTSTWWSERFWQRKARLYPAFLGPAEAEPQSVLFGRICDFGGVAEEQIGMAVEEVPVDADGGIMVVAYGQ
jgi:hypothetical protein